MNIFLFSIIALFFTKEFIIINPEFIIIIAQISLFILLLKNLKLPIETLLTEYANEIKATVTKNLVENIKTKLAEKTAAENKILLYFQFVTFFENIINELNIK